MPKYSRLFTSAALIAVLVVSSILFSNVSRAQACGGPPPQTLLELFMNSDLALIADIASDEIVKVESEHDYGRYLVMKKYLRPAVIFKGQPQEDLYFKTTDFYYRPKNDDGTTGAEQSNGLRPGTRYLIFLRQDKDSGEFELPRTGTAVREMDVENEELLKRHLSELAAIVKTPKDQLPALTEWLVKLVEEPATLDDGVSDLGRSFSALANADDEEAELEDADEEPAARDKKIPFILTSYSQTSSPEIAESLTDGQKQRISSVLDTQVRDALATAGDEEGGSWVDYGLVNLACYWERDQFTLRAHALLLSSDPADSARIGILMTVILYAVENDETLNSIHEKYEAAVQGRDMDREEREESANEDAPAAETGAEKSVQSQAPVVAEKAIDKKVPKTEAEQLGMEGYKAMLIRKFSDRYQYLLARGFEEEEEIETAGEDSEATQGPEEIKELPLIEPLPDPTPDRN